MAESYEINLEIQGGEQPALVMETEGGATDGASARAAEAWANGTRNGVPVEEGDPAYNKSSKYYRDSAAAIAAGDVIDDDAGIGDYDLTWSADKLAKGDERKAPVIVVSDATAEAVKTFADGADGMPMGLTVGIEPVQDLHGQENPWPAGGGKNKFPITMTTQTKNGTTFTVSDDGEITISGTPSELTRVVLNNAVFTPTANMIFSMTGSATGVRVFCKKTIDGAVSYPTISPTSNIPIGITIEQFLLEVGTGFTGTVTVKMQLEEGSTATDWVPYSNVCPISGWTGAEVTRTGKNLLHQNLVQATTKQVTLNGSIVETGDNKVWLKEGVTYTISFKRPTSKQFGLYCSGDNTAAQTLIQAHLTTTSVQFTPAKSDYFIFWVYHTSGLSTTDVSDAMIEIGSTATEYTPFVAKDTYQITFPSEAGTVYGATLTENADGTGTLVVDRAEVDLGTLTWNYSAGYARFYSTSLTDSKKYGTSELANAKCEIYEVVKRTDIGTRDNQLSISFDSVNYVNVKNSSFTDASTFTTAMSGIQLVYELDTPVTYTLSAPQVETLKGNNVIFADTGDIKSVDYPADTKLYIDGKVAELQAMILENISNS